MRIRRSLALLISAAAAAGGLGLAACGGGGSDKAATTSGDGAGTTATTAPGASGGSGITMPAGDPTGKVRVVNVFLRDGKPFGPLDFYDKATPGPDDKPIIAGLDYGKVSDYVRPRSYSSGMLFVFPAGSVERQADGFGGQGISNSGWAKGEQATVVFGTGKGVQDGDPTNPSYSEITETDTNATWAAVPGKSLVLASPHGVGLSGDAASVTLVIDGKCPMRVDPENSPGGGQGLDALANGNAVTYEVSAGSHRIGLLASDPTTAVTTCDAAAAMGTATVEVPKSGRVEVFVYGTSPADVRLVTAPVDEP